MARILPIVSFKSDSTAAAKNNSDNTYKYPVSYEQFKTEYVAQDFLGSVMTGGAVGLIAKGFKASTRNASIIGAITFGLCFAGDLIANANGRLQIKYLDRKHRFEHPEDFRGNSFL